MAGAIIQYFRFPSAGLQVNIDIIILNSTVGLDDLTVAGPSYFRLRNVGLQVNIIDIIFRIRQ